MIAEDNPAVEAKLGMDKETYDFFIAGLRLAIKEAGYKQKDFADGIMDPVTLSNNLTGKRTMIEENIVKCARKLNKDVSDIVLIGKAAEAGDDTQGQQATGQWRIPAGPTDFIDPDEVVSAVQSMATLYRKADARQKWWKEIVDMLPSPTLVFRENVLVFQNKMSQIWGDISGKTIDEIYIDEHSQDEACPLRIAIKTNQETSVCKYIKKDYYKITASPVRFNGIDYYIVSAVEINEFSGNQEENRRGGEDRRKTERGVQ